MLEVNRPHRTRLPGPLMHTELLWQALSNKALILTRQLNNRSSLPYQNIVKGCWKWYFFIGKCTTRKIEYLLKTNSSLLI